MALELKLHLNEHCKGSKLTVCDITRPYDATDNQGGYGAPNEADTPADFDSLSLSLSGPNGESVTVNLLPLVPTPDVNGVYSYELTAQALGLSHFQSGQWGGTMTGVIGADTFTASWDGMFTAHIEGLVNNEMLKLDPVDPLYQKKERLATALAGARRLVGACGNVKKAVRVIEWLYANYRNCC